MSESASFLEILFDLFLWSCIYFTLTPVLRYPYCTNKNRIYCAYLLSIVFCLFPFFGGDYFHYIANYENAKLGEFAHIEHIYIWFIQNLCPSYHIFRLGVWGLALIFVIHTYKRTSTNFDLTFFFFSVIFLPWFSYARASLAMALIIFGLSFIAVPIKRCKSISYVLGIFFIFVSIVFHRSALIGISCAFGSLLFRNPNKRNMIVLCILFPVIVYVLGYLLNQFMTADLGTDDYITGRQRDDYLTSDVKGGLSIGIGPYIMVFLMRAPLFLIGLTYIYCAYSGLLKEFPAPVKIISSYAFIAILLAFAFCFNLGFNTYTLYYRTLIFAQIPSAVFLTQLRQANCTPTLFKIIYYTSVLGVLYTLVYSGYCTLV